MPNIIVIVILTDFEIIKMKLSTFQESFCYYYISEFVCSKIINDLPNTREDY
jgi:hypothetical protein